MISLILIPVPAGKQMNLSTFLQKFCLHEFFEDILVLLIEELQDLVRSMLDDVLNEPRKVKTIFSMCALHE